MRQVIPYPKNEVIPVLTESWVECFSKVENQEGFMWVLTAHGFLPKGVEGKDERVVYLCELAKKHYQEGKRLYEEETKDSVSAK